MFDQAQALAAARRPDTPTRTTAGFSRHLTARTDTRVGDWAAANNVEFAYVPFYGSWLNRIEPQCTPLRYFALDGTDHPSHEEQASMIRRYVGWRNPTPPAPRLRKVVRRGGNDQAGEGCLTRH